MKMCFIYYCICNLFIISSCIKPPIFVTRDTKNYDFLYDTNKLKLDSVWSFSLNSKEHNYVHCKFFDDIVVTIIDFKMKNKLEIDSIYIDTMHNDNDLNLYSRKVVSFGGKYQYFSYLQNYNFEKHLKIRFSDINDIDTIFRSNNYVGFITDQASKFGFFSNDEALQMVINDKVGYKSSLNVFYLKNDTLYFIQLKSNTITDINYMYINFLKLE